MNGVSELLLAHIHRNKKFFQQLFAGMSWLAVSWNTNHGGYPRCPLMIIYNFNVRWPLVCPSETDAILLIDANTVFLNDWIMRAL